MKRSALIVAAAGVIAALVPAAGASAAGSDAIQGGCGYNTLDTPNSSTYTGVIYDTSATSDASGLPTDATVSCRIDVNGVTAPNTTYSYSGFAVQAGFDRVSYTAEPYDDVEMCQRVQYADGVDTGWECKPPIYIQVPPEVDPIELVFYLVDPIVCAKLAGEAGDYGPISIRSDGDLYVADPLGLFAGEPFYDCPPYGNY